MFSEITTRAIVPVDSIEEAEAFYGGKLGLEKLIEHEGIMLFKTGRTHLVLYESDYAGTNQGTTVLWEADDPEVIVRELAGRGVEFETYDDMAGITMESGSVHRVGKLSAAWFRDPFGNILCIGMPLIS